MKALLARRRRDASDRGAVLVEAALVMPLFLLMILALMEYGNLFKDSMSVNNATRDGGREVSASAGNYDADYAALMVARRSLGPVSAQLQRVIIYRAKDQNDVDRTKAGNLKTCLDNSPALSGDWGGYAGYCNIYSGSFTMAMTQADQASFGFVVGGPDRYDKNYPALTRQVSRSLGGEFVGICIDSIYNKITNAVPVPSTLTKCAVYAMEVRSA
jgi:hypothetical protein